jgi:uncharacterized membrane protein
MNLTADLLGPTWYRAALPVGCALLVYAAYRAPWQRLADSTQLNVFLGTVVSLVVLWSIHTGVRPGLSFHLLGATACTLMFGPRFALIAMTLVMIGAAASGSLHWWSLPLNLLIMGAVPVGVSAAILFAVERWLPAHLFVYIFAVAFFGAAAAMLATGVVATLLLVAGGVYPFEYLQTEYLPWFILLAWAEAFTTGAAITLMVVYRPQWVATFDDARYLRRRE